MEREFELQNNNLRGTIPLSIRDLSGLRTLLLYDNELTGTIPVEIGQLANLEALETAAVSC